MLMSRSKRLIKPLIQALGFRLDLDLKTLAELQ